MANRLIDDTQSRFVRRIVLTMGLLAAVGGGLSFGAWFADVDRLKDWFGTGIVIKANTALAILLAGLGLVAYALRPQNPWLPRIIGITLALIGGLTLSQYLLGWNLHIDELLVSEPPGAVATSAPGRMGPPASASFITVGLALVCLTGGVRQRRIVPILGIATAAIGLLSVTGYLYHAEMMYAAPRLTGISLQSALMLLALNLGLLAAVPERQPMRTLLAPSAAGLLARRLLPVIVLLPLAVGWLRLVGQRAGWYDTAFGAALHSLAEIFLLAALGWWTVLRVRDFERATQEMERRKDEFLALLAHELRNPLAPVMNTLTLLEVERGAEPALQSSLGLMRRQMSHMVRLIDDLLDVSRISRGKLELRKQRTDLLATIRQAVEMNQPLCEQFGHRLELALPAEPLFVDGDPSRLAQVIGNVLNNACRYTPRGGHITLRAERRGTDAVISIADTGLGIPPDKLETIFEMFTQLDSSLERSSGGLGIGLHLVRQLVEMHGGDVRALSAGPGQGTQVLIRLPTLPVETTAVPATLPATSQATVKSAEADGVAQRARILVVDDNHDSAMTLSLLLKKQGNDVQLAHDGEEAVARAVSFQPDIILLDIGLPKLNGYDACRAIRAQTAKDGLVIVALTGWGQEEDRQLAQLAGFDAHLTKPVDHALLATTLRELRQRTTRSGT